MQAYGNFDAVESYERAPKGLIFIFTDGPTERVSGNTSHQDIVVSSTHTVHVEVGQDESIADLVLYCAYGAILEVDKANYADHK